MACLWVSEVSEANDEQSGTGSHGMECADKETLV